jgi:hypothetical protein
MDGLMRCNSVRRTEDRMRSGIESGSRRIMSRYQQMNFIRIGGHITNPLPVLAHLQTDGSFWVKQKKGRCAAWLEKANQSATLKQKWDLNVANSTQSEWMSIEHGILFALENNEECMAIENDNLGVVSALIGCRWLSNEWENYCFQRIHKLAKQSVWTGIRWIPRELNKADQILR